MTTEVAVVERTVVALTISMSPYAGEHRTIPLLDVLDQLLGTGWSVEDEHQLILGSTFEESVAIEMAQTLVERADARRVTYVVDFRVATEGTRKNQVGRFLGTLILELVTQLTDGQRVILLSQLDPKTEFIVDWETFEDEIADARLALFSEVGEPHYVEEFGIESEDLFAGENESIYSAEAVSRAVTRFSGSFAARPPETRRLGFHYSASPLGITPDGDAPHGGQRTPRNRRRLQRLITRWIQKQTELAEGPLLVVVGDDRESWFGRVVHSACENSISFDDPGLEDHIKTSDRIIYATPLVHSGKDLRSFCAGVDGWLDEGNVLSVLALIVNEEFHRIETALPHQGLLRIEGARAGIDRKVNLDFFTSAPQVELEDQTWAANAAEAGGTKKEWHDEISSELNAAEVYSIVERVGVGPEYPVPSGRKPEPIQQLPSLFDLEDWDRDRIVDALIALVAQHSTPTPRGSRLLMVFPDEPAARLLAKSLTTRHGFATALVQRDVIDGVAEMSEELEAQLKSLAPERIMVCDESTVSFGTLNSLRSVIRNVTTQQPAHAFVVANYSGGEKPRPDWLHEVINVSPEHPAALDRSALDRDFETARALMLGEADLELSGQLQQFIARHLICMSLRKGADGLSAPEHAQLLAKAYPAFSAANILRLFGHEQ